MGSGGQRAGCFRRRNACVHIRGRIVRLHGGGGTHGPGFALVAGPRQRPAALRGRRKWPRLARGSGHVGGRRPVLAEQDGGGYLDRAGVSGHLVDPIGDLFVVAGLAVGENGGLDRGVRALDGRQQAAGLGVVVIDELQDGVQISLREPAARPAG